MKIKFWITLLMMGLVLILVNSCEKDDEGQSGAIKDIDGNVYHSVTIGTQVWMVENLKTTRYNDGTEIPNITDNDEWAGLTTGAYCNYENDLNYVSTYGRLYNWYAANSGKLAPRGWHVPTKAEFETLITYLGGRYVAYEKLKEAGTTHWTEYNEEATNESGFTALPGGFRHGEREGGSFGGIGNQGCFVSSTGSSDIYGYFMFLHSGSFAHVEEVLKAGGHSVRCIKD